MGAYRQFPESFSYVMAVSFTGRRNQRTRRKPAWSIIQISFSNFHWTYEIEPSSLMTIHFPFRFFPKFIS
jgi:hypothetical protein